MNTQNGQRAAYRELVEKRQSIMAVFEELPDGIQVDQDRYNTLEPETAQALNEMADAYTAGDLKAALSAGLANGVLKLCPPNSESGREERSSVRTTPRQPVSVWKNVIQNLQESLARLRDDPEQRRLDRERGLQAFRELQATAQKIKAREEAEKTAN